MTKRIIDDAELGFLLQDSFLLQALEDRGDDVREEIDSETWDQIQCDTTEKLKKYETLTQLFTRVTGI